MRRLAALLLLSACSQQPPAVPDDEADPVAEAGTGAADLAADPAGLRERVDRAMAGVLQDPRGARYRNLRPGLAGTVCGEVDPSRKGGGHAGYRPFLLTPEGVARVAASPRLSFDDPADTFPDFYLRWCATPDELRRLGPELQQAIARAAAAAPPVEPLPAEPPPGSLPGEGGEPPAAAAGPGPGPAAPSPDVDSFIKSVKRKQEPARPSGQ